MHQKIITVSFLWWNAVDIFFIKVVLHGTIRNNDF